MIPVKAEEESELSSILSHLEIGVNDRDYLGALAPIEMDDFVLGLRGELCDSGSLDNSRGADKESELSSVLNHSMLIERLCQL
jgi:hypothetical protein